MNSRVLSCSVEPEPISRLLVPTLLPSVLSSESPRQRRAVRLCAPTVRELGSFHERTHARAYSSCTAVCYNTMTRRNTRQRFSSHVNVRIRWVSVGWIPRSRWVRVEGVQRATEKTRWIPGQLCLSRGNDRHYTDSRLFACTSDLPVKIEVTGFFKFFFSTPRSSIFFFLFFYFEYKSWIKWFEPFAEFKLLLCDRNWISVVTPSAIVTSRLIDHLRGAGWVGRFVRLTVIYYVWQMRLRYTSLRLSKTKKRTHWGKKCLDQAKRGDMRSKFLCHKNVSADKFGIDRDEKSFNKPML